MLTGVSPLEPLAPRTFPPTASDRIRLLDADPDLAIGLRGAQLVEARRQLVVPAMRRHPGRWTPPEGLEQAIGVLIVDGILIRRSASFGQPDVQLFGPGDLLDPRLLADAGSTWTAVERLRLVILDDELLFAVRRWPAVMSALARRLFDCQQEQHTLAAINTMPRVEDRVLGLLSHLAQRWGHVGPDGFMLALPLTHELLGRLIGARRPTVSLALKALSEDGRLRRRPQDGRWILPMDCADWPTAGIHAPRQPGVDRRRAVPA